MMPIGFQLSVFCRTSVRVATAFLNHFGRACTIAVLLLGSPQLWANPTAPVIKAGNVTFTHNGNTLTVDQTTSNAIVNWGSFGNHSGETIRFNQPGATAAILNRVTGGDPTQIFGQLSANGRVFVINPRGILVGAGAVIDTHAFIASTHDISDASFLGGGDLSFASDSTAGIVNLGTIKAEGGDIVLIARTVENRGTLTAANGLAALAAGTDVLLKVEGSDRIFIKSEAAGAMAAKGVDNEGVINAAQAELKAAGGSAYALAVNNGGSINATGIASRNGRIVITSDGGDVIVSGDLTAKNTDGSGGEILVGGDDQGSNSSNVARAASATITSTARLDVSAIENPESKIQNSSGGKIVVWSDGLTKFEGAITATGAIGGNAEVSGKILTLTGHADLSGRAGQSGTLLLDPTDLTINNSATAYDAAAVGVSNVGNAWINTQLATANVSLTATNSITGNTDAPITWSTANALSLTADSSIVLNGAITGSNAGSALNFNNASIVNVPAAITAGQVSYASHTGAARSTFNLTDAANQIARVMVNNGEGSAAVMFSSSFKIVSGQSLTLGNAATSYAGVFNVAGDTGVPVTITATGDLTLENTSTGITTDGASITLRADGGQFVNLAGNSALQPGGRALVYSMSPFTYNGTAFNAGGLTGFAQQRGVTSPADPLGTGNVFYFNNNLLTITAVDASRIYGAANPTFFANSSGLANGDTSGVVTGLQFNTAPLTANAGSYTLTPFGASAANYDLSYVPGTLTIDRAMLNVNAAAAARAYGAANPTFTAAYSGLVNGDTGAAVVTPTISTAATASSGVGTYTIAPSGPTQTTNYNINYAGALLTINPANLTVTADNKGRDYGDANPAFTATGAGYVVTDTNSLLTGVAFNTTAMITSNVGTYTITPSGGSAANYAITSYVPGTLTINPAALYVTASNATRTYGATNPLFTGLTTGLKNSDTFDFSTLVSTATVASGVGAYALAPYSGGMTNYTVSVTGGNLAITPAMLTLTADNKARTYSDANPAFTYSLSGLVNSDTAPTATSIAYNTLASQFSDVGAYAITPVGGAATSNPNYVIGSFAPGTLTINPLALTLTANDASRLYGDANPMFSATYVTTNSVSTTSGSITGIGALPGNSTVRLDTPATPASNVGDYAIAPTVLGGNPANYVFTLAAGKLTITPAPLTITPYLTLTSSTSPQTDYTSSPLAALVTQVMTDYKVGGAAYTVTTYKQELVNASTGMVRYVKVVSTPVDANSILRTNTDGTVDMAVNNLRYTSTDGTTYVRDTTPSPDNSQGTVTFNPNAARAITVGDPLPSMGLAAIGLKNNDGLRYTYATPSMPSANANYALAAPVINAGANYTVTLNAADLSFRLNPLRLSLVLPDISIPSNLFVPPDADQGFKIAGDLTLGDFTQLYLSQIKLLNAPSDVQLTAVARGQTVSATLGTNLPSLAPSVTGVGTQTIVISSGVINILNPDGSSAGQAPSRPPVPAVGTTAIERIAGFTLGNRNFIADAVNRIAAQIKAGATSAVETGYSPTALKAFYPVTPTISFNNPYLTGGVQYDLAYKTILPSGALIKTPKSWSNLIVGPALPPPLPPTSQTATTGIVDAQAAILKAAEDAYNAEHGTTTSTLNSTFNQVNVSNDYDPYKNANFGMGNVRSGINAFGLTAESNSFLAKALWAWAASTGQPLPRGEADAATIAALYQKAMLDPAAKVQIAGILSSMMLDILTRQSERQAIGGDEQAFVNDLTNYIQQRQVDSYNKAMAAVNKYERGWIDANAAGKSSTNGSMLSAINTGLLGTDIPEPPREALAAAGQWMPNFSANDPTLSQVSSTVVQNAALLSSTAAAYGATGVAVSSMAGEVLAGGVQIGESVGRAIYPHAFHAVIDLGEATQISSAVSRVVGAAGMVVGVAATVASVIAAVIAPYTEHNSFLKDVHAQGTTIAAGDPKATALALLTNNPYDKNADPVLWQKAEAQRVANGYSQAGVGAILALMTAMVCGDPVSTP